MFALQSGWREREPGSVLADCYVRIGEGGSKAHRPPSLQTTMFALQSGWREREPGSRADFSLNVLLLCSSTNSHTNTASAVVLTSSVAPLLWCMLPIQLYFPLCVAFLKSLHQLHLLLPKAILGIALPSDMIVRLMGCSLRQVYARNSLHMTVLISPT